MKPAGRILLSVALVPALFAGSPAAANPRIIGNGRDARCREALQMANAAFRSTSGSLLWPIASPARSSAKIVLAPNARDISGGHALTVDDRAFATLPSPAGQESNSTTYWARGIFAGRRLVVIDEPFNWRGNWYYVFVIPGDVTPERFTRERNQQRSVWKPALGDNRWNPPVILRDAKQYWLIDRGEPYEVMPDWKIYVQARQALTSTCRISFGYSAMNDVSKLAAVHRLAVALDEALGPGTGEGTLHQTAAIRTEVAKEWANASLRPWALTDAPYNSRGEVERGLAAWARGSAGRAALIERLARNYPAAERELASVYAVRFKDRTSATERMARRALDHMFRSYFVFSKNP